MKIIWKRPDGFHNSSPTDYRVVELASGAKLWLHKSNTEWFPFRVSGDWKEEENTIKINRFINLLGDDSANWPEHLLNLYFNSQTDDSAQFLSDIKNWVQKIKQHLKGDTWELDIMNQVVGLIGENINKAAPTFLQKAVK